MTPIDFKQLLNAYAIRKLKELAKISDLNVDQSVVYHRGFLHKNRLSK